MNPQPQTPANEPTESPVPAPEPIGNPFVASVLAWMLFGLGHLYLGRVWKAVVLFTLLSAMFITGLVMSDAVFIPAETRAYSFWIGALGAAGYFWAGLYYFGAIVFAGTAGDLRAPHYEVGWVAALAAALLNLLAILDAWDIAQRKKD
jgi:hypothetical protein